MNERVLIVDDSATVRRTASHLLRAEGYETHEACDGEEAHALVTREAFGLVLCDVNMPRLDGLGFLQRLAEREGSPPVIMMTTEGQSELVARARSLGAKGWLVKPVQDDTLLRVVGRVLGRSRT